MTTTGGKRAGRVSTSFEGVLIHNEEGEYLGLISPDLALTLLEQLQEHEEDLRKRAERERYCDGVRYAVHVITHVASGDLPDIKAGPYQGPDVIVTMDSRADLDAVAAYLQRDVETRPTYPMLMATLGDRVTYFVDSDPQIESFRVSFQYDERVSEPVSA